MDEFSYAHRDTSTPQEGESKGVARFNKPHIPPCVQMVRERAFAREIPVASDETLCFLLAQLAAARPARILELGTAVGATSAAMLLALPQAELVTVERDENFYAEATANFEECGVSSRVDAICGDAGEVIERLSGQFNFIFMDCAKVQYIKYLPRLKQLLARGGVLIADDVLLYGWATGEAEVPKKRRMLAKHIEEYLAAVTADEELVTSVVRVGDGMAISVKK